MPEKPYDMNPPHHSEETIATQAGALVIILKTKEESLRAMLGTRKRPHPNFFPPDALTVLVAHIQKLVQVNAAVGVPAKLYCR